MIRQKQETAGTPDATTDLPYKILTVLEKPLGYFSTVGDQPIHPPKQFPWIDKIEENWRDIRAELDAILEDSDKIPAFQDISSSQAKLTSGRDWQTFLFYGYGLKSESNCRKCPQTTALLEQIPGMKTAFFSILAPGKHIPPHRGPYKGVLRYHLGLLVPDVEACTLRVADEYAHWQEGKSLIFDDAYEHEVWNNTDGIRVVLFVDFLRPLAFPISWLNQAVVQLISLTPFVRRAQKRQLAWDRQLAA